MKNQTRNPIYQLIGDIRECQVNGETAIKLVARKKYSEAQALIVALREFRQIGDILRKFEKEFITNQPKPTEQDLWQDI